MSHFDNLIHFFTLLGTYHIPLLILLIETNYRKRIMTTAFGLIHTHTGKIGRNSETHSFEILIGDITE
jgi:hypothetical protein